MSQTDDTGWLYPFATGSSALSEVFPFGPALTNNVTTFSNSLGVTVPAGTSAQACVDGDLRCVQADDGRFSVFILPSTAAAALLRDIVSTHCAFVYRWFTQNDIELLYDRLHKKAQDAYQSQSKKSTSDQITIPPIDLFPAKNDFLTKSISLPVARGAVIGVPRPITAADPRIPSSTTTADPMLEFEVVYLPPHFLNDSIGQLFFPATMSAVLKTIRNLLDHSSTARRLDPVRFYDRAGLLNVAIFANLSRRILVEARDEYDDPYQSLDDLSFTKGGVEQDISQYPAANGIIAIGGAMTSGGADPVISRQGYEFGLLPASRFPYPELSISQNAPYHIQFQTICLSPDDDLNSWFVYNTAPLDLVAFSTGNVVQSIRDGVSSPDSPNSSGLFNHFYREINDDLRSGDVILLANWYFDLDLPLLPLNDPAVTLRSELMRLAGDGVILRLLLFNPRDTWLSDVHGLGFPPTAANEQKNGDAADTLNALMAQPNPLDVIAIYDSPPTNAALISFLTQLFVGVPLNISVTGYHQKFAVILRPGRRAAVGFAGGIDFNPNRLDNPLHFARAAYHDVHCRIEGPAVQDLYSTFEQRWDWPRSASSALPAFFTIANGPGNIPGISDLPVELPAETPDPTHNVQIARTYNILFTPLSPDGSTTPLDAFLRAISKAKHFIYIEDQYLFPFAGPDVDSPDTVGILTALLNALDRGIEYLVIVGPHHLADSQASYRKALFLSILLNRDAQAQTNRVRLYYPVRGNRVDARLSQASGEGDDTSSGINWPDEEYVHSKVWIVDDICAKIGSANCNRRSYTNDHELDVVVVDSAIRDGYRGFARDLRISLWAEHLNISVGKNLALCQNLYDYRTAIEMLEDFVVQGAGRLRRHVPDIANTDGKSDTLGAWDHISDPDGRVPN